MRNNEKRPNWFAVGLWGFMALICFIAGFFNPFQFFLSGICLIIALAFYFD